jgi:hypothetical protein
VKVPYPVDVLWCGNSRGKGWSFPAAVRKRLQADFEGKRILHLFGGRSTFGTRLDIDAITDPDVIGDAWAPPFAKDSFDVVILDPPYLRFNAQEKNALFRGSAWIARETVVWFHTIWASQCQGLKTERAWLVRCGDQNYVRCLQYFHVYRKPAGPCTYYGRGPAMKYNRWLAQPQALPFGDQVESFTVPGQKPARRTAVRQ